MWRSCVTCGRAFQPRAKHVRHCSEHELEQQPSPSTVAGRDPVYRRNRKLVLAGSPCCHWCPAPATTADHLVPAARGGGNELANLVPACEPCNKARRADPDWAPPDRSAAPAAMVAGQPAAAAARPLRLS
jgi:5-methylcytosine-specific restriction endonuclease McrA